MPLTLPRAHALCRRMETGEGDARSVVDLLTDQVEFADVLLLNKCDLLSGEQADRLEGILRRLNPMARFHRTTRSRIDLRHVLGTGLFDMDRASRSAGWVQELLGNHVPETVEYGISSFVYRRDSPFDGAKLWALVHGPALKGVVRSKGFFWTAQDPDVRMEWAHAGQKWDAVPNPARGDGRGAHTEVVFIGIGVDQQAVERALDGALATDTCDVDSLEPSPFARAAAASRNACGEHAHGHNHHAHEHVGPGEARNP